jgi:hypothetical protein
MGTADVLSGAMALIQRGYCIGANAVDARDVAVRAIDPEAAAWSLHGALLRVTGEDDFQVPDLGRVRASLRRAEGLPRPQPGGVGAAP